MSGKTAQPAKRRRYDAAFRAEVSGLASESRSTQTARRAFIDPKRLYKWQKKALTPVAAAELRYLLALAQQQAQDILKSHCQA